MASKASKRRRKKRRAKGPADASAKPPAPTAGPDQASDPSGTPPGRLAERRRRRRAIDDEPPPAPWGSFPLVELTVLVGIVMLLLGLLAFEGERGVILIGTGLVLASIGGLEVSIREHFAGYRSHTLVLAALPAAVALGLLFWLGPTGLPPVGRLVIGGGVFAAAAYALTRLFRTRSGGYSYRFSGLRRR